MANINSGSEIIEVTLINLSKFVEKVLKNANKKLPFLLTPPVISNCYLQHGVLLQVLRFYCENKETES